MIKIIDFLKRAWKKVVLAFVVASLAVTGTIRACNDIVETAIKNEPTVQSVLSVDAYSKPVDAAFEFVAIDAGVSDAVK